MKRVLIITYYWPPAGGSGVQRWVKFCKYLPEHGWQPVIYTPENPEMQSIDHSLEADIPAVAEIVKRPITEIYSIYRKVTGKSASQAQVNMVNSQEKSWKQRLVMKLRGRFFVPDPRVSWVKPSVKFLKEYLKEHPVDVLVSTGPPHSMHLIAQKVSKATGIPWVADFRDPWTKIFYFKHLELSDRTVRKHQQLEQAVLDDATTVVAVSPLVQEEFRQRTSTPVELITNGFDPDDFSATDGLVEDGFFNITHTGQFAADGNPTLLWEVLSDKCRESSLFAEKLRIRLAGKTDVQIANSIKESGLEKNLINLGYINHDNVIREQSGSCVLLLPLRKEPEYRATLPGKLFEYLGARRPILGIGQTDGAMARVVSDANAGLTVDWTDKAGMKDFVDKAWNAFLSGETLFDNKNIDKYSRVETARAMAALFDKIS
ncbi:MAG: glycosyltransferase [Bacteroidales bacterium]|nr:glycosyltransferase [Bacteroidales bacterium]